MRRSELESTTVRNLVGQAREILVQEQHFTPEKAKEYLCELAQADKLFLADAAAQIIAVEGAAAAPRS